MSDESTAGNSESDALASARGEGHDRSSVWQSVVETCKYVGQASADKSIVVREQDKVSLNLLRLAVVFALIFIVAPMVSPDLRSLSFTSTVLADLLFALALTYFVARRFGVLRSMGKRHALVCCQLMLGSGILVALVAINVAAIIIMFCMGDRISGLFG